MTPRFWFAGLAMLLVLGFAVWGLRLRRGAAVASAPHRDDITGGSAPIAACEDVGVGADTAIDTAIDTPIVTPPRAILHRLYAVAFDEAAIDDAGMAARAGHAEVVARAVAILSRIETQPRYTPRRPQLLPQLMQTVNDADASLRSMAAIIAQDPALAGNLLRIANSPMYRVQSKPVENIERAVAMLGTQGIRLIIAAALMQPVMNVSDSVFGRFPEIVWQHTLLSAAAAASHAQLVEQADPFAAQLVGLLHGLGSIIVVRVVRDEYARQPELTPDASVAAALLDAWAASTARKVAQGWGLSDRMQQALQDPLTQPAAADLSPWGRSLRFGQLAGALALLCRIDAMDEADALATLATIEPRTDAAERIWRCICPPDDALAVEGGGAV